MTSEAIYQPTYGNSWALIIGINAYINAPPLGYARSDAEGIANVLEIKFGFPDTNIRLIVDEEATRENILASFMEYTKGQVGADDRIIVFFAGHGVTKTGSRGEVGFLVPVDGTPDDLATLIRWDELTRNSELISAKHILFIMDACYGGLAWTRHVAPGTMRFAKDMLQRYSRQVLTAGKANEVVADSGGPRPSHSIFTGHLLDALEGASAGNDAIITANGVMAYVYDRVAKDHYSHQTPHYGYFDGDGDFIFNDTMLDEVSSSSEKDKDILIEIFPTSMSPPEKEGYQALSERVKEYLSEPKNRIQLDDLVTNEIRRVLFSSVDTNSPVQTENGKEQEFAVKLKRSEHRIADLQTIVTLLAKWGTSEHRGTLEKVFSRLGDRDTDSNGMLTWPGLDWYSIMVIQYSGGIAALSAPNYENLAILLTTQVRERYSGDVTQEVITPIVEYISNVDLRAGKFKTIPGHERNHVPRSEYLFKALQPILEDILFLGKSYELLFDKFEIFLALVYADITCKDGKYIWGPPGRFCWKYTRGFNLNNPFSQLINEAEKERDVWGPIKAGLFQGTYSRFKLVAEEYEKLINEFHFY